MARAWRRVTSTLMGLSLVVAGPLAAQRPQQVATGARATRASLESALQVFENAARSPAYSVELRERARQEATAVRTRLQEGDFRSGDSIILSVEGQLALTDTFVVRSDRSVVLPTIGKASLVGVLRSELEPRLTEIIAGFIRDPIVAANSFIRLSVSGEVGQPGFHLISLDMPLPDALMVPSLTSLSKVEEIEVVRGKQRILGGEQLQLAIREGTPISDLGIRSGDQIVVPARPQVQVNQWQLLQSLGFVSGVIFTLGRVF